MLTISPKAYEVTNPDQMGEIPDDVVVERAFGLDTARHLSIAGRYFGWMAQPDRWISWWPGAVFTGMGMIQRYRPSAIMSTFPIATAHRIGLSLHKRTGLPWVADFRDSMTEPGYPRDPMTWKVQRRLEERTVHACTKAVFTTEPTRQMYADRYPDIPASRWAVIENGFDEENFRAAETGLEQAPKGNAGPITLVHSGILYPKERDPRPFFAAVAQLKRAGVIDAKRLRIVFRATGSDDLYIPILADLDIGDIVRLEPVVAYRDALREMLGAEGLLLFQGEVCNHQIPAKIYEYYRSGRPILALIDHAGISATMLREAGVKHLADIANAAEIAATIERFVADLTAGVVSGVDRTFAMANSRQSRTKELANILEGIA